MVNNSLEASENEKELISSTDDTNYNGNDGQILSGCSSNDDGNQPRKRRRKCNENVQVCEKQKKRESYQRISSILRKTEETRTVDEVKQLDANADIVRQILKRREHIANTRERILEKEDPPDVIEEKARKLANVLSRAQHLVCYTGAGISTSAQIPDYRGSQGIWTLLQQGKQIGQYDLSLADPTFTHMALYELHRRNILRYTLSQNCDGLHLRSGLPRKLLSEVHGNMYVEVCKYCKPNVEYWRLFDTTELTARYNHKTNRRCHFCLKPLIDTIVHFGERGRLKWPLNWENACQNADKADVILCLGSSLKVLKKYTWLWQMDRPKSKRPKVYIVNLQWTPKDKTATLKINGKCDEVMRLVMKFMNINVAPYDRRKDPIFAHASLLLPEEVHTVSQPHLKPMQKQRTDQIKSEPLAEGSEKDENEDDEMKLKQLDINLSKSESNQIIENAVNNMKTNDIIKTEPMETNAVENVNQNGIMNKQFLCGQLKTITKIKSVKMKCSDNDDNDDDDNDDEIEPKDCMNMNNDLNVKLDAKLPAGNSQSEQIQVQQPQTPTHTPTPTSVSPAPQRLDHGISTQPHGKMINSESHGQLREIDRKTPATPTENGDVSSSLKQAISDEITQTKPTYELDKNEEKQDDAYLKTLINYYRAIEGVVPHWYDVNYAYSGLHSIIHPPPTEVDIWSTAIIPIFQLNRNSAECEFCFDNYAEDKCQFYKPFEEFHVPGIRQRNGKRILCECCDVGDNFDIDNNDEEQTSLDGEIDGGSEGTKTNSEEDDTDSSRSKRLKIDENNPQTNENGKNDSVQRVVQPGWYGKGYRKTTTTKRKRTRKL